MDPLVASIRQKAGEEYAHPGVCALAFSGGIDSQAVGHILVQLGFTVVPVVIEAGADMKTAVDSAKKLFGKVRVIDIRPQLAESALRAVKANCLNSGHLNAGALSRPLMAQALAEAAHAEGAAYVAHGSSGLGNDHLRMELALRVIAPDLRMLAPVRDWNLRRNEALEYAKRMGWKHGELNKKYSVDENLWGRIVRQGAMLEAGQKTPEDARSWVKSAVQKEKTSVEITFLNGNAEQATIAQGKRKASAKGGAAIITLLNAEGGKQGIGLRDAVVEKIIGLKNRELHECPAATILVAAHHDLEMVCLTSAQLEAKSFVDRLWNKTVYEGGWFTRLRRDLDAFIESTQAAVDGKVTLEIHNGSLRIVGRHSPRSLYDSRLTSRDKAGLLNQKAAAGFAKIYGLQDTIAYLLPLE